MMMYIASAVWLLLQPAIAVRNLQIVSPLQALTIWDPEVREAAQTHRSRFLPRFRAALQAEMEARKESPKRRVEASGDNWAKQAASADRKALQAENRAAEAAFDSTFSSSAPEASDVKEAKKNPNKYQFVGVINQDPSKSPITWYSRQKPANANWSVRLVHVNRAAILKDLFDQGKIDIFAKYDNTGFKEGQPVVVSSYTVRERSWKNLWNFSPKHLLSDSSGMFWRERRLRPGLYTDGNSVYEATYRYHDGRNGMHRISSLENYLSSKAVDDKQRARIAQRVKEDCPDVVLEE